MTRADAGGAGTQQSVITTRDVVYSELGGVMGCTLTILMCLTTVLCPNIFCLQFFPTHQRHKSTAIQPSPTRSTNLDRRSTVHRAHQRTEAAHLEAWQQHHHGCAAPCCCSLLLVASMHPTSRKASSKKSYPPNAMAHTQTASPTSLPSPACRASCALYGPLPSSSSFPQRPARTRPPAPHRTPFGRPA